MKNEINEVAEPDIEIVVRSGEREIAILGIFKADATTWDVVVGVDEADNREYIRDALQLGIDAISRAHFSAVRSLGDEPGGLPPWET